MPHNCQAEAQSGVEAPGGGVALPEPLEYVREKLGIDPLACVADRDLSNRIVPRQRYSDATTHRSEFDRIGEQIPCHLLQPVRIAANECASRHECVDDLNSFGLSSRQHNIKCCMDHRNQIDPAKIEPQLASYNARHVQYVFDQLDLCLCIPVYNLNRAPGRFIV